MIHFFSETEFTLQDEEIFIDWLSACIDRDNFELNEINFVFCDDDYLLEINRKHLQHDYYTDIITFDYSDKKCLAADIFISVDTVADNSYDYNTTFEHELARVMVHGVLHLMGYKDKSESEQQRMREKENDCLSMLFTN